MCDANTKKRCSGTISKLRGTNVRLGICSLVLDCKPIPLLLSIIALMMCSKPCLHVHYISVCRFLQTIDNIALQVCLDGYWTRSLMDLAQDVVDMKFAVRHHYTHHCMQTFFVVLIWSGLVAIWGCVHWKAT